MTPRGLTDASNERQQLDTWQGKYPTCNWAVVTGQRSGVWVLDVDGEPGLAALASLDRDGKRLPETLTVSTARGSHLYFSLPAGTAIKCSAGKIAKGLDVRGEGGYAVIPPAIHASGVTYLYIDEHDPSPAPAWLLLMIQGDVGRAENHHAPVIAIGPGERTPILFATAGKLRALGVPHDGILAALRGLNATFAPPHEEAKLLELARGINRYPAGHTPGVLAPDLICLADVVPRQVPWLWPGYLAFGMMAMLSGDPDAGKTFIALAIAADLSNGRIPVSGEECEPMSTLYLSNENAPEYVIRPRFDALRGTASHFHLLRGSVTGNGDEELRAAVTLQDIHILDAAIDRTRAKLLIVDPVQSYMGADVDAHRANETRPVMDGLIALGEKYGTCVLVVRHLAKASSSRAIHSGLGSIDLTGAVRMEMIAGNVADDTTTRAMVQIKNNVGPRAQSLAYKIVGEQMQAKLE